MRTKPKKILVIGDMILDVYHTGTYIGQSLSDTETPVGKATSTTHTWGGAGFLVRNILALGGAVTFVSYVGTDDFAKKVNLFKHAHLTKAFSQTSKKSTTVKERFWLGDKKHLGWHRTDDSPLPSIQAKQVLGRIRTEIPTVEKVIVADYRHGLLSASMARQIVKMCAAAHKPIYIDSQVSYGDSNHHWYEGATLFCLNQKEASRVSPLFDPNHLRASMERLQQSLRTPNVVIKLGERGCAALFDSAYFETRAHTVVPVDTTGAGDAFLASLAIGGTPLGDHDLEHANIWAGLSTTVLGTEVPPIATYNKLVAKIAHKTNR